MRLEGGWGWVMADAMAALAMALRAAPTSIALPKRKGEGGLLSEAGTTHK
jgi:hypothetical protein